MLVEIRDIEYDVDNDDDDDDATEMEILSVLPKTIIVHVEDSDLDEYLLDDYLSDYISDKTGFCHKGFEYEVIAT